MQTFDICQQNYPRYLMCMHNDILSISTKKREHVWNTKKRDHISIRVCMNADKYDI